MITKKSHGWKFPPFAPKGEVRILFLIQRRDHARPPKMRKMIVNRRKKVKKASRIKFRGSDDPGSSSPISHVIVPAIPIERTIQFSIAIGNRRSLPARVFRVIFRSTPTKSFLGLFLFYPPPTFENLDDFEIHFRTTPGII